MKVRCGYTCCRNNIQSKEGYFCNLNEISLIGYSCSIDKNFKSSRMICEQYKNKEDYFPSLDQLR